MIGDRRELACSDIVVGIADRRPLDALDDRIEVLDIVAGDCEHVVSRRSADRLNIPNLGRRAGCADQAQFIETAIIGNIALDAGEGVPDRELELWGLGGRDLIWMRSGLPSPGVAVMPPSEFIPALRPSRARPRPRTRQSHWPGRTTTG